MNFCCVESGDSDITPLKSKPFGNESRSLTTPGPSSAKMEADIDFVVSSEPTTFTDKMVSGNGVPSKTIISS